MHFVGQWGSMTDQVEGSPVTFVPKYQRYTETYLTIIEWTQTILYLRSSRPKLMKSGIQTDPRQTLELELVFQAELSFGFIYNVVKAGDAQRSA